MKILDSMNNLECNLYYLCFQNVNTTTICWAPLKQPCWEREYGRTKFCTASTRTIPTPQNLESWSELWVCLKKVGNLVDIQYKPKLKQIISIFKQCNPYDTRTTNFSFWSIILLIRKFWNKLANICTYAM